MTTNSALEKAIRAMAEELADGVVKLISTMSLRNLAALTEGGGAPRGRRPRELPEGDSEADAPKRKGAAKKGAKAEKAPKASAASKKGAKGAKAEKAPKGAKKPRTLERRSPDEMSALREGILAALRGSGDWMSSKDISNTLKGKPSSRDLLFPIGYLRDRGMIQKKGNRGDSMYKITDKGMSDA